MFPCSGRGDAWRRAAARRPPHPACTPSTPAERQQAGGAEPGPAGRASRAARGWVPGSEAPWLKAACGPPGATRCCLAETVALLSARLTAPGGDVAGDSVAC